MSKVCIAYINIIQVSSNDVGIMQHSYPSLLGTLLYALTLCILHTLISFSFASVMYELICVVEKNKILASASLIVLVFNFFVHPLPWMHCIC